MFFMGVIERKIKDKFGVGIGFRGSMLSFVLDLLGLR